LKLTNYLPIPFFNLILEIREKIILIIDDHVHLRDSLKNTIKKILLKIKLNNDYIIKEGIDGSDMISEVIKDQFESNRIECIITDENMDFINGSEAIKILRKLENKKKIIKINIASLTAFEDEMNRKNIKDSGVDMILSKPINEKILFEFFLKFNIFN